jgi:hypothetical protein
MRDASAFGVTSRKCAPKVSPYCSGELTPFSLAKAKAVFFWVSVGSTSPCSPVMWASEKSPRSEVDTFRSRISCRSVSR